MELDGLEPQYDSDGSDESVILEAEPVTDEAYACSFYTRVKQCLHNPFSPSDLSKTLVPDGLAKAKVGSTTMFSYTSSYASSVF